MPSKIGRSSWGYRAGWILVVGYAITTVAVVVAWIREPSIKWASDAIIGALFTSYFGFVMNRSRQKKNAKPSESKPETNSPT